MEIGMEKILSNKTLLIVTTVIAVFNLIGYVVLRDTQSVTLFILLGLLTYSFSKNMIIVLGVPLVLVNLFRVKGLSIHSNNNYNNNIIQYTYHTRMPPNSTVISEAVSPINCARSSSSSSGVTT